MEQEYIPKQIKQMKQQRFQQQDKIWLQQRLIVMIVAWQFLLPLEQEYIPNQIEQMKQQKFQQEDQICLQ